MITKCWVHLLVKGEFYYNTTFHVSIGMSPFKFLYGYDGPTFPDLVFDDCMSQKDKVWIQEIQYILKENFKVSQNQYKMYADKHRVERSFQVGDVVFSRLHPYRKYSLKEN